MVHPVYYNPTAFTPSYSGLDLIQSIDVVIKLRQGHIATRSLQLVVPLARCEILVVLVEHFLSCLNILHSPELQDTLLIMHILHRRLPGFVCVIHGGAGIEKVDGGGIAEVANAVVHCVVDVPASQHDFLLIAEAHQCPISHSYTAQAGAFWNVHCRKCAIACTL